MKPAAGVVCVTLAACAGFGGGCSTKRCAGTITCANQEAHCDSVPGCQPTPACQYSFTTIDTTCQKQTTTESCAAVTTSACVWSAPACVSACGSITDPQACDDFSFTDPRYAEKNFPCIWSTCSGIPEKRTCGDYPVDACPAQLGCKLTESDPVGT